MISNTQKILISYNFACSNQETTVVVIEYTAIIDAQIVPNLYFQGFFFKKSHGTCRYSYLLH